MRHFFNHVFSGHAIQDRDSGQGRGGRHGHGHGRNLGQGHIHDHVHDHQQGHEHRSRHCHSSDHHGRGGDRGHSGRGGGGRGHGGSDGGGNFMRGRKFSSDDLQLLLLALLAERPSHGYELIKALHTRTEGFYSPSPGMVYPALTYIEELGYAIVTLDGNKKSYSLSPEGVAYLASMQSRVEELFAGLVHMAQKMKYLRGAISEETIVEEGAGWLPIFVEARRALKRALMMKSEASHEEQQRIAAILARATDDINKA